MGDFSSWRMRDSYSTVGRFLRLASWRRVATVFPFAGLPVGLDLLVGGMVGSSGGRMCQGFDELVEVRVNVEDAAELGEGPEAEFA
jgi:hypothetical protein